MSDIKSSIDGMYYRQLATMDNTFNIMRQLAIDPVTGEVYVLCTNNVWIINRHGAMDLISEFGDENDVIRVNASSFTLSPSGDIYIVDDHSMVYRVKSTREFRNILRELDLPAVLISIIASYHVRSLELIGGEYTGRKTAHGICIVPSMPSLIFVTHNNLHIRCISIDMAPPPSSSAPASSTSSAGPITPSGISPWQDTSGGSRFNSGRDWFGRSDGSQASWLSIEQKSTPNRGIRIELLEQVIQLHKDDPPQLDGVICSDGVNHLYIPGDDDQMHELIINDTASFVKHVTAHSSNAHFPTVLIGERASDLEPAFELGGFKGRRVSGVSDSKSSSSAAAARTISQHLSVESWTLRHHYPVLSMIREVNKVNDPAAYSLIWVHHTVAQLRKLNRLTNVSSSLYDGKAGGKYGWPRAIAASTNTATATTMASLSLSLRVVWMTLEGIIWDSHDSFNKPVTVSSASNSSTTNDSSTPSNPLDALSTAEFEWTSS